MIFSVVLGVAFSNSSEISHTGAGTPAAFSEQSQVVVETVTKTSTTQKFAAVPRVASDASKVVIQGAGLKNAYVNKEATFTVNASNAGKWTSYFQKVSSTAQI